MGGNYLTTLKNDIFFSQMLLLLILLLRWRVTTCISSPTLEDNKLPTDEEVISDLINSYRGQPEQEIALNLPTDEEAFNEIKPLLQSGNPLYYINGGGHFIASSFPGTRVLLSPLFSGFGKTLRPLNPRPEKTPPPSEENPKNDFYDPNFPSKNLEFLSKSLVTFSTITLAEFSFISQPSRFNSGKLLVAFFFFFFFFC